ncbi:MAG: JAB domain-containing protein [Pseudobdellovibrionaceae bacterium]
MIEISSSLHAFECLRAQINPYAEEVWILVLNSQLKLLKKEMIFRGTADHCLIHPRDIFRTLIMSNASSFIMAHNHPSENNLPSEQDLILTRKIYRAGVLLQIPLNDHLVMTSTQYYSMADQGLFKKIGKNTSNKILEII